MTISTQQSKIAFVGFPVTEAAAPSIAGSFLRLHGGVDVVDVECSHVGKAADLALAAEIADQRQLPLPIPRGLPRHTVNFVPLTLLTFDRAVARFARLTAVFAFAVTIPSVGQIAGLAAILTRAVAKAVRVHFCRLPAANADDRNGGCSHGKSVAHFAHLDPGYFDIACRRIEAALREPDFFVEPPKPVKQTGLFDEAAA